MNDHYEVRNADIERRLKEMGHAIGDDLPKGWGFCLLLFSFGEGGSSFYISNARRQDMIVALDEFKQKLKGGLQ